MNSVHYHFQKEIRRPSSNKLGRGAVLFVTDKAAWIWSGVRSQVPNFLMMEMKKDGYTWS